MASAQARRVAKRIEQSIATFRNAIEWRTRKYGENSLQVATSLHDLGDTLLEENRLEEAVEPLQRALDIRAASATLPDAAHEVRRDAAITRYTIGHLYEQRGNYKAAREVRRTGRKLGQILCDSEECDLDKLLNQKTALHCAKCEAVFYCCKDCQIADWNVRHRVHCKRHVARPQSLDEANTAEASTSAASPAQPTESTAGSSSVQNQVLPADDNENSAGVSEPVAAQTPPKKRKNRKRKKKSKAKEPSESDLAGSSGGPPLKAEEPGGSDPAVISGDTPIEAKDPGESDLAVAPEDTPIEANEPNESDVAVLSGDTPIEANEPDGSSVAVLSGGTPIEANEPDGSSVDVLAGDTPIEANEPDGSSVAVLSGGTPLNAD